MLIIIVKQKQNYFSSFSNEIKCTRSALDSCALICQKD